MKIRPVGAEFFYLDGRTDRNREAFRNFANTPKNNYSELRIIP